MTPAPNAEAHVAPRLYVVSEWEPLAEDDPRLWRPVMPPGSMALIGGDWMLPTGEIVTPVREAASVPFVERLLDA